MALEARQEGSWSPAMLSVWDAIERSRLLSEALPAIQKAWRSLADQEKEWLAVRFGSCLADRMTVQRVNRLRGLGNAIVPSVAMVFAQAIYTELQRRHFHQHPARTP